MTSKPWMPLYVADYRADTAHLGAAEHGAYLLLIMHYWQTGSLPIEDTPLARIACMSAAEWRKAKITVSKFFTSEWRHKRIDAELARAAEISSKRSASAKQKHSNCSANAPPNAELLHTHAGASSQSQSTEQKEQTKRASARYVFEGSVVKLNQRHFDSWTKAYPSIDLLAELTARDAYLGSPRASDSDRENWFISTAQHLANRNMEAKSRVVALKPEQPRGIPGIL